MLRLGAMREAWWKFSGIVLIIGELIIVVTGSDVDGYLRCSDYSGEYFDHWVVPKQLIQVEPAKTVRIQFRNSGINCESLSSPFFTEIVKYNATEQMQNRRRCDMSDVSEDWKQLVTNSSNVEWTPGKILFSHDGMLSLNCHYYRPDEFCFHSISETLVSVKVCSINCEHPATLCIKLCCSRDKSMTIQRGSTKRLCEAGQRKYSPTFYHDNYQKLSAQEQVDLRPHFVRAKPLCPENETINVFPIVRNSIVNKPIIRILKNGKLNVLKRNRKWHTLNRDFCITGFMGQGQPFSGEEEDQAFVTCDPIEKTSSADTPAFYIPAFLICSVFLLMTLMVYLLLWNKQNVHGWTVLSFVSSMLAMFIFLAASNYFGHYIYSSMKNAFLCSFVGAAAHYFFLSTFSWLTILNFDLWWTFKSMSPKSTRSKGVKRFIYYMLFGWGSSAVVIATGIALLYIFPEPLSEVIVPEYGVDACYLSVVARGPYLYLPIGCSMCLNILFMTLSLHAIYKFKKGTRAVSSSRSNNRQCLSFRLFFKLFIIMGVTWIFELISWWFAVNTEIWYWAILDMLNLSQSIGIFVIFVCQAKVLNQLEQKYPALRGLIRPLKSVSEFSRKSTRTTTTSATLDRHSTKKVLKGDIPLESIKRNNPPT